MSTMASRFALDPAICGSSTDTLPRGNVSVPLSMYGWRRFIFASRKRFADLPASVW
jgi:hypothetical protein